MQDIIAELSSKLGLDPAQVQTGAGAILKLVQEHAAKGDFNQVLAQIPGAQQWIEQAQALPAEGGGAGGGGFGGGLLGAASGLLGGLSGGGQGAGLAGVLGKLQQAGFNPESAMQFVPALVDQIRTAVGPETVDRILAQVPGLKEGAGSLLGSFIRK